MWRASSAIALAFIAISLGSTLAASRGTSGSSSDAMSDRSMEDISGKKKPSMSDEDTSMTMTSQEERDMATMMAIQNECNDTFRIQNGYFEALYDNGSFPDETDRTPKCFIRCMLEKMGVISIDGVFDVTQAVPPFSSGLDKDMDEKKDMITRCAAERKETCKCERSYQFYKCLVESRMSSEKDGGTN